MSGEISEKIEKLAFFVTFIVICLLMILTYKPM